MQLLGSIIYITSAFYSFEGVVYLVHWTHSLYYRVVVFSVPLQGHVLHCKGCCGSVASSYRMTVLERLQPQPFTVLLIS